MATTETRLENAVAGAETGARPASTDRILSLAAMGGAASGAVAGAALGAAGGSAFPELCGTLGAMLGSGLLAGGWCLFVGLWAGLSVRNEVRRAFRPTERHPAPPTPAWPTGSGVTG
jgi:hypothetical protein